MFARIAVLPPYIRFTDDKLAFMLCHTGYTDGRLRATLLDMALVVHFEFGRQIVVTSLWRPKDSRSVSGHSDNPCRAADWLLRGMTNDEHDFIMAYHHRYHNIDRTHVLTSHGSDSRFHLEVPRNPIIDYDSTAWLKSKIDLALIELRNK
jgi:hypothetical protein